MNFQSVGQLFGRVFFGRRLLSAFTICHFRFVRPAGFGVGTRLLQKMARIRVLELLPCHRKRMLCFFMSFRAQNECRSASVRSCSVSFGSLKICVSANASSEKILSACAGKRPFRVLCRTSRGFLWMERVVL